LFTIEQTGPKEWIVKNGNEEFKLHMISSSVTNKFFIVADFVKGMAEYHGEEFKDWFFNFLVEYESTEMGSEVIINNIDKIKNYCNGYIDFLEIDFSKFFDESKAKKNSILFNTEEIKEIIKLSTYLKVYSFISNEDNLKLGQRVHKEIYNKFASELINTDIVFKIYNIVKTKTFRYNLTDKAMWSYIKSIQCKDIGIHVVEIFNFIMNNILILCEIDRNPISYFVGVVDESVKWFLRSVYKGSIVYDDSISTEDIHGISSDNLKTYSYNDTLGRMKGIAYEHIYEVLERDNILIDSKKNEDESIIDFHNRLSTVEFISPLCTSVVFPVLSRITKIPYNHFKTISAEHSAIMSVYVQKLLRKVFKSDYKSLFSLLDYYPLTSPAISTTYKIKSIHEYIRTQDRTQNFFGFGTKILPYNIMCHFVGVISRINLCNTVNGSRLSGIPLSKVESDMVNFYTLYFAGELDNKFLEMIRLLNKDF